MPFVNNNGILATVEDHLTVANNMGLKYGYGAFETIRVVEGLPVYFPLHMERLQSAMQLLQLYCPRPEDFYQKLLEDSITLLKQNGISHGSIRIQVYALNSTGTQPMEMAYCIESKDNTFTFHQSTVSLTTYRGMIKSADAFSHLKHCNYLPYIMASRHAMIMGFDDALIFNQYGRVCETSRANLFCLDDGIIHTPPLTEGCIAGIYRSIVLDQLERLGWMIKETPISYSFLEDCDEIFLTNSLRGIMRVAFFEQKKLEHTLTDQIIHGISAS